MKKYVMPVTEIVTVEMPKLLSGSLGATTGVDVQRYNGNIETKVENTDIFSYTNGADVEESSWGN